MAIPIPLQCWGGGAQGEGSGKPVSPLSDGQEPQELQLAPRRYTGSTWTGLPMLLRDAEDSDFYVKSLPFSMLAHLAFMYGEGCVRFACGLSV